MSRAVWDALFFFACGWLAGVTALAMAVPKAGVVWWLFVPGLAVLWLAAFKADTWREE